MRMALDFDRQCQLAGLPVPTPEYQFAKRLTAKELAAVGQTKPRKWAIDWAFVEQRLAVECDGGYATGGRHTRVAGWLADQEKLNTLTCLGWRLLRVTPRDIASGAALGWVERALAEIIPKL